MLNLIAAWLGPSLVQTDQFPERLPGAGQEGELMLPTG